MSSTTIKFNFHKLIDKIDNDSLLNQFYQALLYSTKKEGKLWNSLSKKEQDELMSAYEESKETKNLIPLNTLKEKHKKWLSK